jgi:hypothetical protein
MLGVSVKKVTHLMLRSDKRDIDRNEAFETPGIHRVPGAPGQIGFKKLQ